MELKEILRRMLQKKEEKEKKKKKLNIKDIFKYPKKKLK